MEGDGDERPKLSLYYRRYCWKSGVALLADGCSCRRRRRVRRHAWNCAQHRQEMLCARADSEIAQLQRGGGDYTGGVEGG